jgi:hypothetical protein
MAGVDHAPKWQREQAGVQPTTAQVFGERAGLGVPGILDDGLPDLDSGLAAVGVAG